MSTLFSVTTQKHTSRQWDRWFFIKKDTKCIKCTLNYKLQTFFLRRITFTLSVDTTMLTFFFFIFFSLNSYWGGRMILSLTFQVQAKKEVQTQMKPDWLLCYWNYISLSPAETELFTRENWNIGKARRDNDRKICLTIFFSGGKLRLSKQRETVSLCFWKLFKLSKRLPRGRQACVGHFHPPPWLMLETVPSASTAGTARSKYQRPEIWEQAWFIWSYIARFEKINKKTYIR